MVTKLLRLVRSCLPAGCKAFPLVARWKVMKINDTKNEKAFGLVAVVRRKGECQSKGKKAYAENPFPGHDDCLQILLTEVCFNWKPFTSVDFQDMKYVVDRM